MPDQAPLFSIILATRNRAASFAVALQSVLEQSFSELEVIIVDDGSAKEHAARCRELVEEAAPRAKMLTLMRTEHGHGAGYARNRGAEHARGMYLCFLDDDDQWTSPEHLARAAAVATAAQPELILANQRAFCDGRAVPDVIWIEDLKDRLCRPGDTTGAYSVSASELLECPAHCHLNTTIISRRFYFEVGGFDEALRYEEDRDLYLRAIDLAASIKYLPVVVSRHNIPDSAAQASMSTSLSELAKRLYQLRVFDKATLCSARSEVRRYAMRQRAYVLRHIANAAARAGQSDCARYYRLQALIAHFIAIRFPFSLACRLPMRFNSARPRDSSTRHRWSVSHDSMPHERGSESKHDQLDGGRASRAGERSTKSEHRMR